MNIMLVSVTKGPRDWPDQGHCGRSGISRQQFLFESILISLIGAIFGIILGIISGTASPCAEYGLRIPLAMGYHRHRALLASGTSGQAFIRR